MATHTYTPSTEDSTASGKEFYQDIELSPANLASGELQKRFNTRNYPQLGQSVDPVAGAASLAVTSTPATPSNTDHPKFEATLNAGLQGAGNVGGTVAFFLDGAPLETASAVALASGKADYTMTGTLASGAHAITAKYDGSDPRVPAITSAPLSLTVA